MERLLYRKTWQIGEKESPEDFEQRRELQVAQLVEAKRIHGQYYLIKFGEDDIRPMREDNIEMKVLREQIRNPLGIVYDCPLCQPYDIWGGLAEMEQHRRYCTRVINPQYKDGCMDEGGVWLRCPCSLNTRQRVILKFKDKEAKGCVSR